MSCRPQLTVQRDQIPQIKGLISAASADPAIQILVATRAEDASREWSTGGVNACETERPHQCVNFRREN